MRVTTWNRPRAEIQDSLDLLAPLGADLVALQECRRPDGDSPSAVWRGEYEPQGSAVVGSGALPIEPIEIPSLHPTVVPVVVQGREPFVFVGVWTHPPYNEVAWTAMKASWDEAVRRSLPMVAAGDFNSSPRVQGQERKSPQFVQRMHDDLGLVSAWHHFTGEALGEETCATYYHLQKESDPFHIDYCFLPETWVGRLTGVEVGSFADWPKSDHKPLTVDLDV
ncbi:MAG: hypothetical protein OXC71_02675 [Chloroflexi bacterium]|nr:hypothetical protein [Chloroflexota bacterium]